MNQTIIGIYTAPGPGEKMISHEEGVLEAGKGVVGDRYYEAIGTFTKNADETGDHEVTLVESEEIDRFNADHDLSFNYGAFRRNLITQGVRLNDLVGQEFRIGSLKLAGIRLCEPCAWLAELLVPEVLSSMVGRCGLRARIVEGGRLQVGESIETSLSGPSGTTHSPGGE